MFSRISTPPNSKETESRTVSKNFLSPETLQIFKKILKKSTSKKPAKFRDANPRRTKGRKRKEKGKGSKKKKKINPSIPPHHFSPEKRKGENTDPFAMHNHAPRPSPRATSSGKPPSSLSKSITASGRVSPPSPHDFLFLDPRRENPPPASPSPLPSNSIRPRVIHDRPKVALD